MNGLLERADELAVLREAVHRATDGAGSVVLIGGEAGTGKSALLAHAFPIADSSDARVLWGACDPLFTPRPLGPLHDIARQVGGALLHATTSSSSRETLFGTMLDELQRPERPTVVIAEDAHWADEATLDLLKFLGRRIHRVSAILLISYRDDEVGPAHPLRVALGQLPAEHVRRLHLSPLSRNAVEALARDARRAPRDLYEITGGNPFFVTEVLAADDGAIPVTVRDAVMARAHSVSQRARGVMELAAMVPPRIERWLVDELLAPPGSAIDECLVTGMVQGADGALAFRHELARRAIADAMPPERQRTLHADCLAALLGRENAVAFGARIVHHAEGAGDSAAVLAHAPFAAAQAAAVGAHREAAALYGRALRASYDLQPSERASLLERYSMQCYLSEPIEAACDARAEAITLWRAVGDRLREGDALRWLSRLWWIRGDRAQAERFAAEAIAVLETLPPGHELAMAYSNRAQLAMLVADADATIEWGTRALAIAEPAGDTEVVVHTMINVGTAESTADRPGGIEKLQRGLAIALANDQPEQVARGYANLATHFLKKCDYDRAAVYLRDGLAYFDERDMSSWSLYLLSWRAHVHFERGEWAQAEADASSVLEQGSTTAISRIHALVVLARLRMHKSEKGSDALLDEARDAAVRTGERQRILHVSAARAESAWLAGDLARTGEEAALGWAMAAGGMRWEVGQLALMLWRANRLTPLDATLPLAVERQVAGDWRAASTEWKRLGSPLQEALAMAESDDADALRYAFDLLVKLGSKAGCALVRRRMRALGLRGIRRGERASTRSNPARLTTRQLEILALLCEGLRDAEIATQCFLSTKTVGHHVSAILGKLGVRSRGEASAAARAMGIVAPQ